MARLCMHDGCDRKHVARGLCGTHYNQQHQPNRHRKVQVACVTCRELVMKDVASTRANRFCSYQCRDTHRRAISRPVVVYRGRSALGMFLGAHASPQQRQRTWVAGSCRVCGKSYLCKYGSATCGDECQAVWYKDAKRDAKHRRRARERDAFVANVYRTDIYRRDDYTCRLCGGALDMSAQVPEPYAPTIDHVIPLAQGGTHEPANAQAAHFLCNALKGDRLEMRGRVLPGVA